LALRTADASDPGRRRHRMTGESPDWIKVKNPDAPAATRILE
jgi:hypothetical protein